MTPNESALTALDAPLFERLYALFESCDQGCRDEKGKAVTPQETVQRVFDRRAWESMRDKDIVEELLRNSAAPLGSISNPYDRFKEWFAIAHLFWLSFRPSILMAYFELVKCLETVADPDAFGDDGPEVSIRESAIYIHWFVLVYWHRQSRPGSPAEFLKRLQRIQSKPHLWDKALRSMPFLAHAAIRRAAQESGSLAPNITDIAATIPLLERAQTIVSTNGIGKPERDRAIIEILRSYALLTGAAPTAEATKRVVWEIDRCYRDFFISIDPVLATDRDRSVFGGALKSKATITRLINQSFRDLAISEIDYYEKTRQLDIRECRLRSASLPPIRWRSSRRPI